MKKVDDLNSFFDEYVFEEALVFSFAYTEDSAEFTLLMDDPNVATGSLSRNFVKLQFTNVRDYRRFVDSPEYKKFETVYDTSKYTGSVVVRELTVGLEEVTNEPSFYLYLGGLLGEVTFYFRSLYVDVLETYAKEEDGNHSYYDKATGNQVDFKNPFGLTLN